MRIAVLSEDQARNASGLLLPEVTKALAEGLPATVLIALEGNRAVGALGGAIDGKVFEIVSLYVEPESRRRGAAGLMLKALTALLKDTETMIRAQFNLLTKDHEALEDFFKAEGFEPEEETLPSYYYVPVGNLLQSMDGEERPSGIKHFSEVDGILLRNASNQSIEAGLPVPEGGLTGREVDPEVSSLYLKDGKVEAYIAAEHEKDGIVLLSAMYSALADPRELMSMLLHTARALNEKYPPETKVAALAINNVSSKIIEHIFDTEEPVSRSYIFTVA